MKQWYALYVLLCSYNLVLHNIVYKNIMTEIETKGDFTLTKGTPYLTLRDYSCDFLCILDKFDLVLMEWHRFAIFLRTGLIILIVHRV